MCGSGVHGDAMHVVMRAQRGGTCSSGVHGDATHVVTRAWQGGTCSGKEACEVAVRSTGTEARDRGEGHVRWCVCGCKGHREVVLSDKEPHAVSKLNFAWKRLCTFTSSSLKSQKKLAVGCGG